MTHVWDDEWPIAYPRARGSWSVQRPGAWGVLEPETGRVSVADPSTDERLPGLAPAMNVGNLIGYRPGRRAIVATPVSFVKVLRPRRVDALVARHELLAGSSVTVPRVVEVTRDGRVELTTMAGRSLHQNLRNDPRCSLESYGALIAELHGHPKPRWLAARTLDSPEAWVATSRRCPTSHFHEIEHVASTLTTLPQRADVVVHGDLHDKNIFDGPSGSSLIDLDGLGLGAPEDDVANLGVHLELRNLQAGSGLPFGSRANDLYGSYERFRGLDRSRLAEVERHTWFRLACIYQYRRSTARLVPLMLRAAAGEQGQQHCSLRAAKLTLANRK